MKHFVGNQDLMTALVNPLGLYGWQDYQTMEIRFDKRYPHGPTVATVYFDEAWIKTVDVPYAIHQSIKELLGWSDGILDYTIYMRKDHIPVIKVQQEMIVTKEALKKFTQEVRNLPPGLTAASTTAPKEAE